MADAKSDRSFYRNYYREIDVLHGLQSTPEERDWLLLTTPKDDIKQSDIVLYLGCNVMRTTHLVRTVMDVFKLLDVKFAAVGGGGLLLRHSASPARRRGVGQVRRADYGLQLPEVRAGAGGDVVPVVHLLLRRHHGHARGLLLPACYRVPGAEPGQAGFPAAAGDHGVAALPRRPSAVGRRGPERADAAASPAWRERRGHRRRRAVRTALHPGGAAVDGAGGVGRDVRPVGAEGSGRGRRHLRHAVPRLPAAHVRAGGGSTRCGWSTT